MAPPKACQSCGAPLETDSSSVEFCPACLFATALEADPLAPTLPPGTFFGSLRIGPLLGRGGMAAVYQAFDASLERDVALKVLPPEFLRDETFASRFVHEARVVASLEHPNIVPIYASGIDERMPWISMRLFGGGTLADLIEKERLPDERILNILRDVAEALDWAHQRGVIHRDVKPSNILLDEAGRAYVCDFGLARLIGGPSSWTRTNTVVGTPHYMAPEQALNADLDRRYDIYSLGVVAYEMYTGRKPFTGDSPLGILMNHANAPVPVPALEELSEARFTVVRRALAKNAAERWPTAGAFVTALEEAATTSGAPFWMGRVATGVAAVAVAFLAISLWSEQNASRLPASAIVDAVEKLPQIVSTPHVARTPIAVTPVGHGVKTPEISIDVLEGKDQSRSAGLSPNSANPPAGPSPVATAEVPPAGNEPVKPPPAEPGPRVEVGGDIADRPPIVPKKQDDIVTLAVRTRSVNPEYPEIARKGRLQGTVLLEATVTADGRVSAVSVVGPAHPILAEAAMNAIKQFEFTPELRNGIPVVSKVKVPFNFSLSK